MKKTIRVFQIAVGLMLLGFIAYNLVQLGEIRTVTQQQTERRIGFCAAQNMAYDRVSEVCVVGRRLPDGY